MFPDFGVAPDPVDLVYRAVLRSVADGYSDAVFLHDLPNGYNCHSDGIAVVVCSDVQSVDESSFSRELVKINVFGPVKADVRRVARQTWAIITQGAGGVMLGVSRRKSMYFGESPSFQPTGFVATMSISVGVGKMFGV